MRGKQRRSAAAKRVIYDVFQVGVVAVGLLGYTSWAAAEGICLDRVALVVTTVAQLIRILSASIAPVIVISGVGLVLLSMTNRYSHVIDRARELMKDLDAEDDQHRKLLAAQVQIIYRRAQVLRLAIMLGSASILFVALTVLALFAGQVIGATVDYVSVPCFILCLLALVGSLFFFIRDVTISLQALELEITGR